MSKAIDINKRLKATRKMCGVIGEDYDDLIIEDWDELTRGVSED